MPPSRDGRSYLISQDAIMLSPWPYRWLADVVLLLHFGVVVFIVGGLAVVAVGNAAGWRWVNRRGFRLAHLAAIAFVVAETWLGIACPLTTLESWLRMRAGAAMHGDDFIAHWVRYLLFYEAPSWVFAVAYTVFLGLVAAAWRFFPPARR